MPVEGRGPELGAVRNGGRDMTTGASLTGSTSVRKLQTVLHAKAKEEPDRRFHALVDKVWREDFLLEAWGLVRRNGGAAGVDGMTVADIEAYGVERWVGELSRDLRDGTYEPSPVRQVLIPKKQPGKFRPLGMPARFVVAHLQVGLTMQNLDAPLADDGTERAGVFLTNALTGWEPHMNKPLPFPELEEERDRADRVKQETPILVILGNPPYNGFAGMAVDEERELSEAYRTTKQVRRPEGQGLNDLYVRFFRMAERRIAEKTGLAADPSDTDSRSVPSMRLSVSVKSAPVKRSSKWCTTSSESSGRPRGPRAN